MNDEHIVPVYMIIDDLLKIMNYQDDVRAQSSSAEILTIAVVAAKYFQNHHECAVCLMRLHWQIKCFAFQSLASDYISQKDELLAYLNGNVRLVPKYRKNMRGNRLEDAKLIDQHWRMIETVNG